MAVRDNFATKSEVKRLNDFMALVVVVLFIGFTAMFGTMATMVISHFDNSQATYRDLEDKVQTQNAEIDALTQALQATKK